MTHAGKALIDPHPVFAAVGLAPGMRVADLGCGRTGHFVFPASRVVGESGLVYAVDIIKDIVESIAGRVRTEGYTNVQTAWGDIERVGVLPIPTGTIDVCFMVNVVFMLKDKLGACQEAKRILKSNGFLVVVDWVRRLGPLGPTPEQMLNPDILEKMLITEGFSKVSQIAVGDYHLAYIYKKN
ncbi:MAG: methyltransferase domain-containing protein [Candidatus Magasanikbacteria bacterium]|nr:methyltransferase domain-containing protein [Candidatus Magasanikbacteria bacterium]